MTLSRALNASNSGLSASALRAEVTAGNVANASTPGYVRRNVLTVENIVGGRGNGVRIAGISRSQDIQLLGARREADSAHARANQTATAYSALERALGAPGSGYGIFSSFEGFESAIREAALTPESPALQSQVLATAQSISQEFNSLWNTAQGIGEDADAAIIRDVGTVNAALARIVSLNGDIGGRNEGSGDVVALMDQRQRLIDSIADIVPVKEIPRANGQIELMTPQGVFLLAGSVREFEIIPGQPSTLRVGEQELRPGDGHFGLTSGRLAGHFEVRDNIVPEFQSSLDDLAGDLIARFSTPDVDATLPAGAPGLFHDPTVFAGSPGLASRIEINPLADPARSGDITRLRDGLFATTQGPSGDGAIFQNMLTALTGLGSLPTSGSSSDGIAELTSRVGQARLQGDAMATGTLARAQLLGDAELARSGVDTDREIQNLLTIEQSYAANARVIQTVGDMIDRLLQI